MTWLLKRLGKKKCGLTFGVIVGVFLVSGALAKSTDEIRGWIQETIRQIHPADKPEDWKNLGPEAPKVILQMIGETSNVYRRVRLIQALGHYDDPEAMRFLKDQALDPKTKDVIRQVSVKTVAFSKGEGEREFIEKFLDHEDVHTRVVAAEALHRMRSPEAKKKLDTYFKNEKVEWVKAKVLKNQVLDPAAFREASAKPAAKPDAGGSALLKELNGVWSGHLVWVSDSDPAPSDAPHRFVLDAKSLSGSEAQALKEGGFLPLKVTLRGGKSGESPVVVALQEWVSEPQPGRPKVFRSRWAVEIPKGLKSVQGFKGGGMAQIEIFELSKTQWIELRLKSSEGPGGVFVATRPFSR